MRGLEQFTKGRSIQDQQVAPEVWRRFVARDSTLRELTGRLEQAQLALENALRHDRDAADAARSAVEEAGRQQRRRLEDIATESKTELALTSVQGVRGRSATATSC